MHIAADQASSVKGSVRGPVSDGICSVVGSAGASVWSPILGFDAMTSVCDISG